MAWYPAYEFDWDRDNLDHVAFHGGSQELVEDIYGNEPRFFRNRSGRAATHIMIGPDSSGGFWTVPLVRLPGNRGGQ
jgi:hypothetical protein